MLCEGPEPSPADPEIKVNTILPVLEALGQDVIQAPQSFLNLKAT